MSSRGGYDRLNPHQHPTNTANEKEPDDGLERQAGENRKDEAKGAAKVNLGKAMDDEQMKRKGQSDQTVSNLQQVGEKVRDAFKKA